MEERNLASIANDPHAWFGSEEEDRTVVILDDNVGEILKTAELLGNYARVGVFRVTGSTPGHDEALLSAVQRWCSSQKGLRVYYLIDRFLGPTSESPVGIRLWTRVGVASPTAHRAWLSRSGGAELNRPEAELCFLKAVIGDFHTRHNDLHFELKRWLGIGTTGASTLWPTAERWDTFRLFAHTAMFELRLPERPKGDWAHHLTCGGDTADARLPEYEQAFQAVKLKCVDRHALLASFPEFCWNEHGDNDGWNLPPIRALLQFDGCGRDLSSALERLHGRLQKRATEDQMPFSIDWRVTSPPAELDWLWFNVFAVGEALLGLACQFPRDVTMTRGDRRVLRLEGGVQSVAGTDASARPTTCPEYLRFFLTITQCPGHIVPFPDVGTVNCQDNLGSYYSKLEDAGGEVSANAEGQLTISIASEFRNEACVDRRTPFYQCYRP